MKSYVVEAYVNCPRVDTVVNARNEQEAELKAAQLLKEKLEQKRVSVEIRAKVHSELTPRPEKADHLLFQ